MPLSTGEAQHRLRRFGPNELEGSKPRGLIVLLREIISEPMFLLLLACSIVYLLLGDLLEATLLSSAIFIVIFITFIQTRRTERTLDALRDLSSPRALVIRDGTPVRIGAREVVPDDVVILSEGDRVPADGFVLLSKALKLDESLLTGESVSVRKVTWNSDDSIGQPGGDDSPFVYAGTLVVQGTGEMRVQATGHSTAMGRIGSSLKTTDRPPSALQQETGRVVRVVALSSLFVSAIMAGMWWLRDGDVVRAVLMGLTFAMSTIPEELPVVLTIFLALGAWRISKKSVLTRQMHAVEALGSASFLCVDKTGTLTENKMIVSALWTPEGGVNVLTGHEHELTSAETSILRIAALACDRNGIDPMDKATISAANRFGLQPFEGLSLKKYFPMIRPILAVGNGWNSGQGPACEIFTKGAPETIAKICRKDHLSPRQSTMADKLEKEIMAATVILASRGYRVLAVANGNHASGELAGGLETYSFEFSGLIGFSDPVRAGVRESVKNCHEAGIKVLMITGDFPSTATSIARSIGLENPDSLLTGDELLEISDEILATHLKTVRVLARMVPEQKLRVVKILRATGEIVAMTGDGVNDAPALKAAHIGIAMGGRGTDVAREAAALVLLNDDFTSIVEAIGLGRRINDNIQKAISYIIAIHIPIVGLTILPVLTGGQIILWPLHLAFLQLIIDPVCSIVFESEPTEEFIMKRPPRSITARLFSRPVVTSGMWQGSCALLATLGVYYGIGNSGESPNHARGVAFLTLIAINIGLILTLRSRTEAAWNFKRWSKNSNPTIPFIALFILSLSAIVLYVPVVAELFHFSRPHASDVVTGVFVAIVSLVWFEIYKVIGSRSFKKI